MKIRGKILIFVLLLLILIPFLYIKTNPTIPVLCYHNIATKKGKENFPDEASWVITKDNFEDELKYLKKHNYKTLTMREFYEWKQGKINLPYKSVLITFDDGFLSVYKYALPLLKKYNMNATIFVVGKFAEEANEQEWNGNIRTYISKNQYKKIKKKYPNIEIHSHSYDLHKSGALKNNKEFLINDIEMFNSNIKDTYAYGYPFGRYNKKMIHALKDSNYKLAFIYGPTRKEYRKTNRKDNNYEIPRLNASHDMPIWKFALRLLMPF